MSSCRIRLTRRVLLLFVAVSALFMAACSSQASGDASPTGKLAPSDGPRPTSVAPSEGEGSSGSGAPPIERPLNPAKFVSNPCLLLTDEQRAAFKSEGDGRIESSDLGEPSCNWEMGNDGTANATIWFQSSVTVGLDRVYAHKRAGSLSDGYFVETQVLGYPAVFAALSDGRQLGDCQLNIGVNEDLFFVSTIEADKGRDGCKAAKNLAEAAIRTMKSGE